MTHPAAVTIIACCDFQGCKQEAAFLVGFDRGILDDDTVSEQLLCYRHYIVATPLGTMWVKGDLRPHQTPPKHPASRFQR